MRVIHYIPIDYNSGGIGGLPHFDHQLRRAIPSMETWVKSTKGVFIPQDEEDCLIITSNDDCLDIAEHIPCIAVHHGCGATHWEREPYWRAGQYFTERQKKMKDRPNTVFVGCSDFMRTEFMRHHNIEDEKVILHSVDTVPVVEPSKGRCVIVDARNESKGKYPVEKLRIRDNNFIINDLVCGQNDKAEGYKNGNIYLSLSVSEGNSYSMMDAIACGLPVLGTDVGLLGGNYDPRLGEVISWRERNNLLLIEEKLEYIHDNWESYDPRSWLQEVISFENWKTEWSNLVTEVWNRYF